MRYVTVPEPVILTDNDGKPQKERDPDAPLPKIVDGQFVEQPKLREIGPISLHRLLMLFVINEATIPEKQGEPPKAKIGVGYEGDKRSAKLDRLFDKKAAGEIVAVEDEDWKVVKKILEEKNWNPKDVGRQLFPLTEAWMEATDKKPALKSVDQAAPEPA